MKKKESGKPFKSTAVYVVVSILFFALLALMIVYYHPAAVKKWSAERFVRKNEELLRGCAAELEANAEGPEIAALMKTGKVRELSVYSEGGRRFAAFFLNGKDKPGAGRAILYVPTDDAKDASKAGGVFEQSAAAGTVPGHRYVTKIIDNFYYYEFGPGK